MYILLKYLAIELRLLVLLAFSVDVHKPVREIILVLKSNSITKRNKKSLNILQHQS